jgi:hypothetical protein
LYGQGGCRGAAGPGLSALTWQCIVVDHRSGHRSLIL